MILADTNLLLYAYNTAAPEHPQARAWMEDCLSGRSSLGYPGKQ